MTTDDDQSRRSPARESADGSEHRETRSAAAVAVGILLSRLAGLLRQRVTAYFFGTSALADIIAAAFRIGNITQNLLGEGALSASFIPVYAKLRAQGKHDEAVRFAQSALGLLIVAVVLLSALGAALAPWLSWLVAAGFDADKLARTASLVRVIFPMTGLLVLCALGLGVLNSHRQFFLPYAAPVIWSAVQIAALLIAGSWLLLVGESLAYALAIGALIGAGLELTVLLARTKPLLGSIRPRFDWRHRAVRRAASRLPAVLFGRGIIQISGLVDTLLVSFLGTGANATFAYAQMLYLLPMSLLGTGEAAASLPEMSRDTAHQNLERRNASMQRRLGATLTRVVVLSVPAMLCLIVFGRELIALLLQTGKFGSESTARVAGALAIYGFALLGNASGRLFATTCYALGDTRRPARFAFNRVLLSTAIALLLMRSWGVQGVVVGAAVAAWLEAALLGRRVRRCIGKLGLARIPWWRVVVLAGACAGISLGFRAVLPVHFAAGALGGALILLVLGSSFGVLAAALRLFDVRSLLRRGR